MKRANLFRKPQRNAVLRVLLLCLPALGWVEGLRLVGGEAFDWLGLLCRWGFIVGLILVARAGQPHPVAGSRWLWPWPAAIPLVLGVGAAALVLSVHSTFAAWVWLGAYFVLLLQVSTVFSAAASRWRRWSLYLLLALYAGMLPAAIGQVQGRFSDEEFFVAIQTCAVGLLWLLLRLPYRELGRGQAHAAAQMRGAVSSLRSLAVGLVLVGGAAGLITLNAYQRSFYAPSAPLYDQVTQETPFLCGKTAPTGSAVDGVTTHNRLLAAVANNPYRGAPEYGMLALGTGEERWAQAFRESLLQEAAAQRFSQAANSVKSVQHEAAVRAYYLPRVRQVFPRLFSEDELLVLTDWFAAINRRALTVEWVDWLYAVALARWPSGPYENQESGAGLLSILISTGLEDPALAAENRAYLDQNPRGWLARFRNTDDAFIYQPEWLTNALFQATYTGQGADRKRELSFEWLLLQALPDGRAPQYNHPGRPSIAGIAYLAAAALNDPRFLWLADRALTTAAAEDLVVFAQPGAERPLDLAGESPPVGSCLLYGDSGLPTQVGPLAPDKIVFRDGWTPGAAYLLLNLRFSGWHRYRATNTVTLMSLGSPIVSDLLERKTFGWLPKGRSLLRDKRIPRENLSGLLISDRGIRAVLYNLTGIGSRWAQDPPWHAEVIAFESGATVDRSHTRIADWQGWQHDRYVHFYHDGGPIIVADRATGPRSSQSALVWHLVAEQALVAEQTWRLRLQTNGEPAEVVFVPIVDDGQSSGLLSFAPEGDDDLSATYTSATPGQLQVATVFLTGEWVGADVRVDRATGELRIDQGHERLRAPLFR